MAYRALSKVSIAYSTGTARLELIQYHGVFCMSAVRRLSSPLTYLMQGTSVGALARSSVLNKWACRSISDSIKEEQYIQYSKVPTYHFQPGLPRLAIPKFDQTLQRYLAALRPVCSDEQYNHSQTCVEEFQKEGLGNSARFVNYV